MDLYDNVSSKRRGILKTQGPPLLMLLTLIHGFLVPPLFECGMRFLIILVKASLKPRFLKCVTVICIDSQKSKARFIAQRPRCIFDKISQMSHFTWMTKAGFSGTRQNYHRPYKDHQIDLEMCRYRKKYIDKCNV